MNASIDLGRHELYQADGLLPCDLVMKGGITSGVVYPLAVCEIAQRFQLRNVGGSSAGAIAAAAAAAAEVGRRVPDAGFAALARLPGELGATVPGTGESRLSSLFQPSDATRIPMTALKAVQGHAGTWRRVRALVTIVVKARPWPVVGALVVGAIGLATGIVAASGIDRTVLAVVTVLFAVTWLAVWALVGLLVAALRTARRSTAAIVSNDFGVCSGADDPAAREPGLSTWLADRLDQLAGKPPTAGPLTFGDLRAAGVSLKVFTTNLSDGTPYTVPFKNPDRILFDPDELRRSLPDRVVDWMVEKGEPFAERGSRAGLVRLPAPDDIPVVFATRLSLSFPVLISAVPLHVRGGRSGQPVKSWFSDGGITSNFPVHFFDSPFPRWPTFGINLGRFLPGESADVPEQGIWAPADNAGGFQPPVRDITHLTGFLSAVADTMQNWLDAAQVRQPGYRDRVVLVRHTAREGGMNLNMEEDTIAHLAGRGAAAGRLLRGRFGQSRPEPPGPLSWENHRWLRYRSTMDMLEGLARRMPIGWTWQPERGDRSYPQLLQAAKDDAPGYRWATESQRVRAQALTADLLDLAERWDAAPDDDRPSREAPRPPPILRAYPDF
jgi:predicted acylesterase/phospholipase RssA